MQFFFSNDDLISHRFEIWPDFLLKTLFYAFLFNYSFENAPLALNPQNFAGLGLKHMANYSSKKFFLRPNA